MATKYRFDPHSKMMVAAKAPRKRSAYPQVTNAQFLDSWTAPLTNADADMRGGLRRLVNLSRSLSRSNPYIVQFHELWPAYLFGHKGFTLQSQAENAAGRPDEDAQQRVEDAWEEWKEPANCTVTGDMPWMEFKKIAEKAAANDGNVVILKHPGYRHSKFRFAVQLLEFDHIDLDFDLAKARNGNRIVMGKELDSAGRCVAYHMRGTHPGDHYTLDGRKRTRIEADRVIHRFYRSRPEATFGEPLIVGAMTALRHLEKYEEYEQVAAQVSACSVIGVERSEESPYDGDAHVNREIEAGGILYFEQGEKANLLNPTHPNANYEGFRRGVLMGAAAALPAMGYPVLASDLASVTFSSLREDAIVRRLVIKPYREMNILREEKPVFREVLKWGTMTPALSMLDRVPLENLEKARFYGAGFEQVDPWKVGKGLELMLSLNMADPFEVAIEHTGKPLPELLENMKKARELYGDAERLPAWLRESDLPLSTPQEESILSEDE